jgi:hypothetical protein
MRKGPDRRKECAAIERTLSLYIAKNGSAPDRVGGDQGNTQPSGAGGDEVHEIGALRVFEARNLIPGHGIGEQELRVRGKAGRFRGGTN